MKWSMVLMLVGLAGCGGGGSGSNEWGTQGLQNSSFAGKVVGDSKLALEFNGTIQSMVPDGTGTLYVGGEFTESWLSVGPGILLDSVAGRPVNLLQNDVISTQQWAGHVETVVPDGSGGWFVGGFFKGVGAYSINNLAHILSDGHVDPSFNPNPTGAITALALERGVLYIAGKFDSIGAVNRSGLAAVAVDGTVSSWNPVLDVNGRVLTVRAANGTVYLGGRFDSINNIARRNLAALDSLGVVTAWDPSPDQAVSAIEMDAYGTVYVAGAFSQIAGVFRSRLAAFGTDGLLTTWAPNANGSVSDLSVAPDGTIYAVGTFLTVGGQARKHVVAIDSAGNTTAWVPNANLGQVNAVSYCNGAVFMGGDSSSAVAIDAMGNVTGWNPSISKSSQVFDIGCSDSGIYLVGNFTTVGHTKLSNLAAIGSDHLLTDWRPGTDGVVKTMLVRDGVVYIGGSFDYVGGYPRRKVAAVDVAGNVLTWDPGVIGTEVNALCLSGANDIYVGGDFTEVGGVPRSNVAAISQTGVPTDWNPGANGRVRDMAAVDDGVIVAGAFDSIGSLQRVRLAKVDYSGAVVSKNSVIDGEVTAIEVDKSGTVYLGGRFNNVDGQSREHYAAFAVDGTLTGWNPGVSEPDSGPEEEVSGLAINSLGFLIAGRKTTNNGPGISQYLTFMDSLGGVASLPDTPWGIGITALTSDSFTYYFSTGSYIYTASVVGATSY